MEFSANNPVIRLCLQGMQTEETGDAQAAGEIFLRAWREATNDFEKFTAAYHVARLQKNVRDQINWLEKSLRFASMIDDRAVEAAFPFLHSKIAECFERSGDLDNAAKHDALAASFPDEPSDRGPFYHGTRADLRVGDLLTAGGVSNYKSDLQMNHIYFTALIDGAGLAAALAKGDGRERVYVVEPTGGFENDPNVTNKKFPGNPTRSYRSEAPLKIVGEATEWARQTPEQIKSWREKLADSKGEIIN